MNPFLISVLTVFFLLSATVIKNYFRSEYRDDIRRLRRLKGK